MSTMTADQWTARHTAVLEASLNAAWVRSGGGDFTTWTPCAFIMEVEGVEEEWRVNLWWKSASGGHANWGPLDSKDRAWCWSSRDFDQPFEFEHDGVIYDEPSFFVDAVENEIPAIPAALVPWIVAYDEAQR